MAFPRSRGQTRVSRLGPSDGQPRQTAPPVSADYRREPSFDEASGCLARTIRDEKIDQGDNSERDQGQLVLARNGFLVWSLYAAKPPRWWRRGALTGSRTHASLGTAFSPRDHRLGHGCHRASTSIGPVATASQREGVEGLIAQGSTEGVGSTAGGRRPRVPKRGRFIEPTVFTDADNSHHEIFGPVLSVIPYTGHDAAVKIANDFRRWPRPRWDRMDQRPQRCLAETPQVHTGTIGVNTHLPDPSPQRRCRYEP